MINFTYEDQGESSFLVYEKKEDDIIDTMTLGMVSNNKIRGILPFLYAQVDGSVYMKYNISGKVSLEEFFSGTINRKKFLNILNSIADVVIRAEEYMLETSSFVLSSSYIFVEPKNEQAEFIVLPIEREEVLLEELLRQIILDTRFDQSENCSYIAALISYFNSQHGFNVNEFKKLIQKLQEENVPEQYQNVMPQKNRNTAAISLEKKTIIQQGVAAWQEVTPPQEGRGQNTYPTQQKQPLNAPTKTPGQEKNCLGMEGIEKKEDTSADKPKEKRKGLFGKKEKTPPKEKTAKEKKGLFGRKSDKKPKESRMDQRLGNMAIPGVGSGNVAQNKGTGASENKDNRGVQEHTIPVQQVDIKQYQIPYQEFGATVDLKTYADNNDDTTLLSQVKTASQMRPRLYRLNTGEVYPVTKEISKIGRNREEVDIHIAGNGAVGKIHAVLYVQNGMIYLEDQKSKNGTFIDGIKQEAGEMSTPLGHGSRIRLADEEFEFRLYEQEGQG